MPDESPHDTSSSPTDAASDSQSDGHSDESAGPEEPQMLAPISTLANEALDDPERLRELEESLNRLEAFAAKSKAENTVRAYAADLEDFRHWCKRYEREWLPATPETIGLYLGSRSEELSLATLERRLAAISSLHKEEGYESPASVSSGPLRAIWKGLVRTKTRKQNSATPLLAEDMRLIIDNLPRYASDDDGPTDQLTLASLRDRAVLLVGWTGALRRSEIVALTHEDIEFIPGEGVNVYVRQSKTDQDGEGMVKGLPYSQNVETCPVHALRQWMQAVVRDRAVPLLDAAEDPEDAQEAGIAGFEGPLFRRFYRGESIGSTAITAQYVSSILKDHVERVGLDPSEYSAHSLRSGFITQAVRAGKPERRVKEHSGHKSWETFNRYVKKAGTFQQNPAKDIGL